MTGPIAYRLTLYEDAQVYVLDSETCERLRPTNVGQTLFILEEHFNRRFKVEINGMDSFYTSLHAFAEVFDCPKLMDCASYAYRVNAMKRFDQASDKAFFEQLNEMYKPVAEDLLPKTTELMREKILPEFERRLAGLQNEDKYKDALEHMWYSPQVAADAFLQEAKALALIASPYEWKCFKCAAVFAHKRRPLRDDFVLPACPCCALPGHGLRELRVPTPPISIRKASR